jgi:hypothetical protein
MARNITVSLDEATIREARALAAQRGISVSALVRRELSRLVEGQRGYEKARHTALRRLERGQSLGTEVLQARDELHDRARLRRHKCPR